MVFGANYHKGEVLIYQLTDDGQLKLLNTVKRSGSGPHPNQDQSRVHFAGLTPDKHLIVCDLGTDSVATYSLSNDGSVKLIDNYQASPGAGSRHIVFHPSLKVAYLICELNSTVEVLIYDGMMAMGNLRITKLIVPSQRIMMVSMLAQRFESHQMVDLSMPAIVDMTLSQSFVSMAMGS